MFLGVGWGGVTTFTSLRTPMMLRHGTFTCTCAQLRTYVMLRWRCVTSRRGGVGWGGVGWGGVITFTYLRTPMMLRHGTFTCACAQLRRYVMLRWRCVTSRRGGVGWAITFTYLRTPMMLRHGTFTCTCAHTSCYVEDVSRHAGVGWGGVIAFTYLPVFPISWHLLPRKRTKIEWPHLDVRSHMAVAMGGRCSWKSAVGENRCVLSEDVEITGKNGCRWGFGHADFPKGTFFALRHVNYIQ